MERLGSHRTDFHETWYLRVFRKSVEKIQVSFKSDKHTGYFTWRPIYIFFIISRSFLLLMRDVSGKICRYNQNIYFVFSNFFPPENRAVSETTWKNIVERGRPQMKIWRMRVACWIPKATNTNTHCFSTATMVARTRLNITLYVHCLSGCFCCHKSNSAI